MSAINIIITNPFAHHKTNVSIAQIRSHIKNERKFYKEMGFKINND